MDDLISRKAAIDALWKTLYDYEDSEEKRFQESDELDVGEWLIHRIFVQNMSDRDRQTILDLPSAQPETMYYPQVDGVTPSVIVQPEIVRCKDCEYWRQQTNYQGTPLSFGFCESDDMWQSLYGETYEVEHIGTDDDFYCRYAKRRTDG